MLAKVYCVLMSWPLLSMDSSLFYHILFYSFLICVILSSRDPGQQRVKKWGFSLEEALKDPAGRDQFLKFLESEFSSENLR